MSLSITETKGRPGVDVAIESLWQLIGRDNAKQGLVCGG
jgi:hypothetical protein